MLNFASTKENEIEKEYFKPFINMKKLTTFTVLGIALLLSACGNRTQQVSDKAEADTTASTSADSAAVERADTLEAQNKIETAPDEEWSEEYLHGFVVRVYDKVNEVWSRQEVHQEELDTAFFAKSYLELRKKVLKAEEGKSFDDLCFVEYMPFSQGLIVPIRLNAVKVNLLTGTMAEINFDISDQDGYEVKMWWHLDYANGQWHIDDWKNDPDAKQSMVDRMTAYLKKHGVK